MSEVGATRLEVAIRTMRADEADEVGDLVVASYEQGGQFGHDDGYREEVRAVARRALTDDVLVAVHEASIVGSVTMILPGSPTAEISRDGECEFRFLAVAGNAWGTGVGDILVAGAIAWADARALDLVLMTRDSNAAAHRLYTRNDFLRLPERDWSPVPGVDLVSFRRTRKRVSRAP